MTYHTVGEAARLLGITTRGVRKAIARGKLHAVKGYGVTIIHPSEIERYLRTRAERSREAS